MPDMSKMMFVRPINCHDCEHGYYALGHMVEYAQTKGLTVIDIQAQDANQGPVWQAMETHDPGSIYCFGHGNNCIYTGDSEEMIFDCNNCTPLNGRITYFLSCLTGNGLGPAIMNAGAAAYAGFVVSWTWVLTGGGPTGDPYNDPYARGFFESANELWRGIIDGKTIHEASAQSVDKYNEWIDYWLYQNPTDPGAQECIKYLVKDREGLIFFPPPQSCEQYSTQFYCAQSGCHWYANACHSTGSCSELTNENDCINNGCYWYNNSCHDVPEGKVSLAGLIIPLIIIGSLTYMLLKQPAPKHAKS